MCYASAGRWPKAAATASYPARVFGIHSAMPMARALALCPEAVRLPPRHGLYRDYSRKVMQILRQIAPLVEQVSIDEAYMQLPGEVKSWDAAVEMAWRVQRRVKEEVKLSASLGVATNKLVAKIASDQDKPGGLTVVRPGDEAAFLAPLPVRVLWGVGPKTAEKLERTGVRTVGELARVDKRKMRTLFGKHSTAMTRQAHGIDLRPLVLEHNRKSVSQERTFAHDIADEGSLQEQLRHMSEGVARHLKRAELAAATPGRPECRSGVGGLLGRG